MIWIMAKYMLKPITTKMGKKVAREINAAAYVESSIKNRRRVKNVFDEAIRVALKPLSQKPLESRAKAKTMQSLYIFMVGDLL